MTATRGAASRPQLGQWASIPGARWRHPEGLGMANTWRGELPWQNPRVAEDDRGPVSFGAIPRRVIKGGSHLCAANRPAARQGEAIDTSTSHIGFRCMLWQSA